MNPRKHSFEPVVRADTKVLVLGSLPGAKSLEAGRYYAHPQNRFWHLAGLVIDDDLSSLGYDDRLAALLASGVGLWDTIASARREGSLDAAIRDAEHNPLMSLCESLPSLRAVGFNGGASARIGSKLLECADLALVPLPSSSPAYASMPLAEKEARWLELRKYLH